MTIPPQTTSEAGVTVRRRRTEGENRPGDRPFHQRVPRSGTIDGAISKEASMPIARFGRAALVGLMLSALTTAVMPLLPDARHATVQATVLSGRDEDKDKKEAKEKREKQENADRVLQGQVLEIDTIKDPPELTLGSVDGKTTVRVLKTDEIARNGVQLGDYIEATGEKIHEQLFEATELSVAEHFTAFNTENENKDD
jgi:hypothetical protein